MQKHFYARRKNQKYYAGADAFECIAYPLYFQKLIEKQRYNEDDYKRGQNYAERCEKRAPETGNFIACISCRVDCYRSGRGFCDCQHIGELVFPQPLFARNKFAFYQRNHCVPAAEREQPDFEHCQKQIDAFF